jgi:hypothetical protein
MDNSISIFNGGNGAKSYNNTTGTPNAPIYFRQLTTYGNETGGVNGGICSEIGFQNSLSSIAYGNLAVTPAATGCSGGGPLYVLAVAGPNATDQLYSNFGYSVAGNTAIGSGTGFSFGPNNIFGTNPMLVNSTMPGTPNCSSYSSVPACMATVIANFAPTNAAAVGYGYQPPSNKPVYDPLFPLWLCNINLPSGLVTMGCLTTP